METKDYFNKLLDAIKKKLTAEIGDFKDVGVFGGGFNGIADFEKFTTQAPSCRIGLGGINPTLNTNSNQLEGTADLTLVFITKDVGVAGNRHAIALKILEKVLLLVKDGRWGLDNTYATELKSVVATNHSSQVQVTGVALWEVGWKQRFIIGRDRFEEEGEFPANWSADINIGGNKE